MAVIWGDEEPVTDRRMVSDIGRHARHQVTISEMDLDDDRLDGRTTHILDWDTSGGLRSRNSVHRGTIRIENEAGAWEGPWPGIGQYGTLRSAGSLSGSGAYERLSAILFHVSSDGTGAVIEGAVYPTDIASCLS